MKKFKVKFGIDIRERTVANLPTFGEVMRDPTLKAVMQWGDSLRATVNGVEQCESTTVPEGATVVFETRANEKRS